MARGGFAADAPAELLVYDSVADGGEGCSIGSPKAAAPGCRRCPGPKSGPAGSASGAAYQLNGRYTQEGSGLEVTARLYRFGVVQASKQLSGTIDSLPENLTDWAIEQIELLEKERD